MRLTFETGNHGVEILGERLHCSGKVIQSQRSLCDVKEMGIEISLDDLPRATCEGGNTERAGIGKAIQDASPLQPIGKPKAQIAGVGIEAGVLVEPEIQRIIHAIFLD